MALSTTIVTQQTKTAGGYKDIAKKTIFRSVELVTSQHYQAVINCVSIMSPSVSIWTSFTFSIRVNM